MSLNQTELLEKLAELEHEQWIKWSKSIAENEHISFERFERWQELWRPYCLLTEKEKDQDREYADKTLEIFDSLLKEKAEEIRGLKIRDVAVTDKYTRFHSRTVNEALESAALLIYPDMGK